MALVASVFLTLASPTIAGAQTLVADGIPITGEGTFTIGAGGGGGWSALNGGSITGTGPAFISTVDRGNPGVMAASGGTISLFNGSTVSTIPGIEAVGLFATGAGSTITATGTSISTANTSSHGVNAVLGGVITFNGGSITIGINGSIGLFAVNPGSVITASGLTIVTDGSTSFGAEAFMGGVVNITDSSIVTTGPTGAGLRALNAGSKVTASNMTITTNELNGWGLNAVEGATIDLSSGTIITKGSSGAFGAYAQSGGVITFTDGSITTTGTNSGGLISEGPGSAIIASGIVVATSGPRSGGAEVYSGAAVTVTNSTLTVTGPNAHALFMTGPNDGVTQQTAQFTDSALSSAAASAINILGGTANVLLTGSSVIGNGIWLEVKDAIGNPAVLNLTADSSTLTGAALTESTSNVILQNGTIWNLTGDSNLTNLTNDASLIDFSPPAGGVFKTLTVVNYIGAGGTIALNTFLGTDGSPSDKLVIDGGSASGNSFLQIKNAGGPGDLTVANGILVVDTINGGTTVPGTFVLAGPVVAGPYEYTLFRSSVVATNPQAWYLRSTLDCALPGAPSPPCQPPLGAGPAPPGRPVPNFRQEVSLYAALPALALLYGRSLMDTLHERVGEQEHLRARVDLIPTAYTNGAWGRVIAQHGNRDGDSNGIFGAGPKYDFDLLAIQAGFDVYRFQQPGGARDHAGLYAALGDGRSGVTHFNGIAAGHDTFAAYSVGGYWTHFGPSGWYLDGVVQGTWYDMKGQSTRFPTLETSGWGFAASLEGGYPFKLGGGWTIEPQAQLVYQTISLDDTGDIAASVRFDDIDSLAGRIGVRFANTWTMGGPFQPSLVTAWFRPNLWQEFAGDPRTLFSSATGFIPFRADLGESWVELNSGITVQIDRTTALFANASYQIGLDGRSDAWDGKIGLRVNW